MRSRNNKNWIGGVLAIAAMLGFLSLAVLVAVRQIPVDNKDLFNMCLIAIIGLCTTAFGYYLGSSQGSARKTEISAQAPAPTLPPTDGQAGRVIMPVLAAIMIVSVGASLLIPGCAQKGAVQQVSAQTSDPAVVALATFADAQDAYIAAVELYRPYHRVLLESNPALAKEIIGYFRAADRILSDWEHFGDVPLEDKEGFRNYLREISIRTAQMIEKGGRS